MQEPIRGRFAPTPSGRMHLGNLFTALLSWLDARSLGGEVLLRIEDLDPDRCRPAYTRQLLDDLQWLGLDWDLGGGQAGLSYLQSQRGEHYQAAFAQLLAQGLLYPCYCSRKERLVSLAPHASDPKNPVDGRCRCCDLSARQRRAAELGGRRPAWRIRMPHLRQSCRDENLGPYEAWLDAEGDPILRRSDGLWAYQLAVVVDDGLMNIGRVVRGADLLSSTPRQIWLLETLGFPPPRYAHAPLLTDAAGRRLSKRDRDMDLGYLREHCSAAEITGQLAQLAGLIARAEPLSPAELVGEFSWKKIGGAARVAQLPEALLRGT